MSRRWLGWVLAATCLAGLPQAALAYVPVSEMKDLSADHWAYPAIRSLVEKYQVMEGFPDSTFRGTRTLSRYELAAALSRVMSRVEEMVGTATGDPGTAPSRTSATVTPDDLRMIARLQQEFKDELTLLKGRFDGMDNRLAALEKRLRLGGSLEALYRSYPVQPYKTSLSEADNLRIATHVQLEANPSAELAYRGEVAIFNQGVTSLASGHLATEAGRAGATAYDVASPVYVRRSYFSWAPQGVNLHVGMMTFADTMKLGSTLRNDFRTGPVWPHAEGGYGFAGTPPYQPPTVAGNNGGLVLAPASPSAAVGVLPGRIHYHPGLNAVEDLLDPNSVWSVNTGSSPAAVLAGNLGPVELGVGLLYGAPGTSSSLALADLPRTFPLIAEFGSGYSVGKLGVDLGLVRLGLFGRSDLAVLGNLANFNAPGGKGWGATFDLGDDALGLSVSYADTTRTGVDTGYYTEGSAFVVSNNLWGTGIGMGVGAKLGDTLGASQADRTLSFLPYDWSSVGAYVRLPGFSIVPYVTLAGQMSGQSLLGTDLGSGLSVILEFQITPGMPSLMLEYDLGRFYGTTGTPTHGGTVAAENQLFGGNFATHEQLVLGTSMKF